LRGQLVVRDAGRLDDEEVGAGHAAGDVPGGPGDESVADELAVQTGDLGPRAGQGSPVGRSDRRHDAASRRIVRSRFITSLPPRPNQSCSRTYSSKSRSYPAAASSSGTYTSRSTAPMAFDAAVMSGCAPAATAAWIADPSAGPCSLAMTD